MQIDLEFSLECKIPASHWSESGHQRWRDATCDSNGEDAPKKPQNPYNIRIALSRFDHVTLNYFFHSRTALSIPLLLPHPRHHLQGFKRRKEHPRIESEEIIFIFCSSNGGLSP
ncbi:hypothetical protein K1719_025537 [Acacia pycnantha]|nr:hypothetical protein K1719_025537 [Acacia pycnantha]